MSSTIFRQKSMERISSPEQMNDYIRVSNPAVWMILVAVIVLLAGVCVWGFFGRLDTSVETGGVCADGRLTVYVGQKDIADVGAETLVSVDGVEYAVASVDNVPVRLGDTDNNYLLHLIGLSAEDWVYPLRVDAPGLADGIYAASVITERVKPLDFVLN